jgi:hypothetical protein
MQLAPNSCCPICASGDLEYEFAVEGAPISRCIKCSFMFLNPLPRAEDERTESREEPVSSALLAHVKAYSASVPADVLSIGPSEDIDAKLAAFSGEESFDACILDQSLERSLDPNLALARLRKLLRPHGVLCVCAVSPATAARGGHRWHGFKRSIALYFDVDTLQSLLVKHGFMDPMTYPQAPVAGRNDHLLMLVRPRTVAQRPKLSIIVPVYNEYRTLPELLRRVIGKEIDGVEREIIVVESNSTDGSREEVLKYKDHPEVRIILEEAARGKGHAVRTGLSSASGSIILFQDADLEYDVDDYDALIEPILSFQRNFVIGSRHNAQQESWKIRSFTNAPLMSAVFNAGHVLFRSMLNRLYGQHMMDPFSMFKVFRTECLYGLHFECDRFDFDFEIVIKLVRKGYRPLELPVNYRSRSVGEGKKVTLIRDPITWLRALRKFYRSPLYR